MPIDEISYSAARAQLAGTMNKVCEKHLSPAQRLLHQPQLRHTTAIKLLMVLDVSVLKAARSRQEVD